MTPILGVNVTRLGVAPNGSNGMVTISTTHQHYFSLPFDVALEDVLCA